MPRIVSKIQNYLIQFLGNLWGQSWIYLYNLVKPYSNASTTDVTKELNQQGYTPRRMFEVADEFFQSLGLEPNDICYNVSAGAIIEKPQDREIVCHASAWDFYDGKNYRSSIIKKYFFNDDIFLL